MFMYVTIDMEKWKIAFFIKLISFNRKNHRSNLSSVSLLEIENLRKAVYPRKYGVKIIKPIVTKLCRYTIMMFW